MFHIFPFLRKEFPLLNKKFFYRETPSLTRWSHILSLLQRLKYSIIYFLQGFINSTTLVVVEF